MKVVFVMTQSLESPSGLGRFGPIAREMVKLGHQVQILALHPDYRNLEIKRFWDRGVDVHYVAQMHVRKVGSNKYYFNPVQLLFVVFWALLRLTYFLLKSDATIVQLCKPQPINALAIKLGSRGRLIYCDCDDYEAASNHFNGRYQKRIVQYFEDNIIHYVNGITTNTQFTRQRYIDLGYPKEQILYIPNGIEKERFSATSNNPKTNFRDLNLLDTSPLVGYVGSLDYESHPVYLLLDAFVLVLKQIPSAKLLVVGGGADFATLQQYALGLNIGNETIFTGRVNPNDVPRYISALSVSIDPILDNLAAEARYPLKIIESLELGVPVITGDVGDRKYLIGNDELGLLVNCESSVELSNAIIKLIRDEEMRERMCKKSLKLRDQWDWNLLAQTFLKVYPIGKEQ